MSKRRQFSFHRPRVLIMALERRAIARPRVRWDGHGEAHLGEHKGPHVALPQAAV